MFGRIAVPGTDITISRLGFGAARLYSGRELKSSTRLIEAALEAGISHFDTAPSYASGDSEKVLGQVLSQCSHATITTKIGHYPKLSKPTLLSATYRLLARPALTHFPSVKARFLRFAKMIPRARHQLSEAVIAKELTRDQMFRSVEGSLTRLRRGSLDILLLHEPAEIVINERLERTMQDLVMQGMVKSYGLGYGSAPMSPTHFGTVLQKGFDPHVAATDSSLNSLQIWHGVLRSTQMSGRSSMSSPQQRIGGVLKTFPRSAVIFSASSVAQIRNLAGTQ